MEGDIETPEFVAWCVIRPCLLRGRYELSDPLATERRLKSLRAVSTTLATGRLFDGWCLDATTASGDFRRPRGFAIADVVARWGGIDAISECCGNCESNFTSSAGRIESDLPSTRGWTGCRWTGCFGWLVLRDSLIDLPDRLAFKVQSKRSAASADVELRAPLPRYNVKAGAPHDSVHPWADLWQSPVLQSQAAGTAADLLQQVLADSETGRSEDAGLDDPQRLVSALRAAADVAMDAAAGGVSVRHLPTGIVRGKDWIWPSRCRLCSAPKTIDSVGCRRCGDRTAPLPPVRRGSRGERPYRDLTEVLNQKQLQELQAKVFASRNGT